MSPEQFHIKELPGGIKIKTISQEMSSPSYDIEGINSDMGGPNKLRILTTPEGDASLQMSDPTTGEELSIGFASLSGGYRITPVISEKIGQIAYDIANNNGNLQPGFNPLPEFPKVGSRIVRGMKIRVEQNGFISIRNIQGDQGHGTKMDLILEADSDVIVALSDGEKAIEMEFNNGLGGTRLPCMARRFSEVILTLAELEDF